VCVCVCVRVCVCVVLRGSCGSCAWVRVSAVLACCFLCVFRFSRSFYRVLNCRTFDLCDF
jgi:hypothetical protein